MFCSEQKLPYMIVKFSGPFYLQFAIHKLIAPKKRFQDIYIYNQGVTNSRGSWVVGRGSWIVGTKSWVVGAKSWVVGTRSWVVGAKSVVPLVP